jgi:hypothetical protein
MKAGQKGASYFRKYDYKTGKIYKILILSILVKEFF